MERGLARNWWMLALRGVLAIVFGILVFFSPDLAWAVVIGLFAAFALIDGVLAITAAVVGHEHGRRWWALVLEGVVGLGAGILTLAWPEVTGLVLLYFIGFWAVVTGVLESGPWRWPGSCPSGSAWPSFLCPQPGRWRWRG